MGLFKPDAMAAPPAPPPPPTPATFADPSVAQSGMNTRKRAAAANGDGLGGTVRSDAAEKPNTAQAGLGAPARIPSMM